MRPFGLAAALLLALSPALHATDLASPVGDWRTFDDHTGHERSLVRISEENGALVAHLLSTTDPADGTRICDKCDGDRRDQPVIGLEFMRGMRADGDKWDGGRLLDPETGSVYRGEMHLEDNGRKLVLRGYIGMPMFGRSQTWLRAG